MQEKMLEENFHLPEMNRNRGRKGYLKKSVRTKRPSSCTTYYVHRLVVANFRGKTISSLSPARLFTMFDASRVDFSIFISVSLVSRCVLNNTVTVQPKRAVCSNGVSPLPFASYPQNVLFSLSFFSSERKPCYSVYSQDESLKCDQEDEK